MQMKQSKPLISIPHPCQQDWETMTPAQRGRHCAACQKTVVDFRFMTDKEVITIIGKASGGATCGRFMEDQLGRELIDKTQQPSFALRIVQRAAAVLLLLQSATATIWAQEAKTKVPAISQNTPKKAAHKEKILHGRLADTTGGHLSLAYVEISVKGTEVKVLTDTSGVFVLHIPHSIHSKYFTISVTSPGYGTYFAEQTITSEDIARGKEITMYCLRKPTPVQDIVALSPGIYQKKRESMGAYSSARPEPAYVIDGVQVNGGIGIDMTQGSAIEYPKRTLWQRITSPFRKKHKQQQ